MYDELLVHNLEKPSPRVVFSPCGTLRRWQRRFLESVLMPNLPRSSHSHGGVQGRSILTNVMSHSGSAFLFTADIRSFYPSIRRERVARMFVALGCSEDVAALSARLCTHNHRLEQGLITSPIIADYLAQPLDRRIAGMCHPRGMQYTRYVDDIAISGPFDIEGLGVPTLVGRILSEHGFRRHPGKNEFGAIEDGASVTKLRIRNGRPDVQKTFVERLERQLADADRLARGEAPEGPYYTEEQIRGRVQYVCWVNHGRRKQLGSRLRKIDWAAAKAEAERRQLVECRKAIFRHSIVDG